MTTAPDAVAAMLRARSIALVGASAAAGELRRADDRRGDPQRGRPIGASRQPALRRDRRAALPAVARSIWTQPVDLALLGVGDDALEEQLRDAAEVGVAVGRDLRQRARRRAACVVARDRDRRRGWRCAVPAAWASSTSSTACARPATSNARCLPRGPIALVTHSGSIFSALLRTRRALGYTLAVSSGQELVTTTADYLDFVLEHTDTRCSPSSSRRLRDGTRLVDRLRRAAISDIPVGRAAGRQLAARHRGWSPRTPVRSPARTRRGRRSLRGRARCSCATSPSSPTPSNCWRSDVARAARRGHRDACTTRAPNARMVADRRRTTSACRSRRLRTATVRRLDALLDDGLTAANPLDLWGTGADTRELFAASLQAHGRRPRGVARRARGRPGRGVRRRPVLHRGRAGRRTRDAPLVVLANLASAIDHEAASTLRAAGIPVLEGTSSGLVAIGHLLRLAHGDGRGARAGRSTSSGRRGGELALPIRRRYAPTSRSPCSPTTGCPSCSDPSGRLVRRRQSRRRTRSAIPSS